jgi:ATP-dependent phosphofructokinase / diphosphate-dependent phosphofructokinase
LSRLRGAAVIVHSGGPTPVLNASLAGTIGECRKHAEITAIYGARFGPQGLVEGDFLNLSNCDSEALERLAHAPGSAIGCSRRQIQPGDHERLIRSLQLRKVRYLFYTGGNGSMETALEIHRAARAAGYEMRLIGIPKTIDNDVDGTDHTPGYASCARFFAHVARDLGADKRALPRSVGILEVLGRTTGWVVAATALARHAEDDPPHLIYFPEDGLSPQRLCADVERVYRRVGYCLVAVCEGQRDEAGGWFGAELSGPPGGRGVLPVNLGRVLAKLISSETGLHARAESPGLVGRSCAPLSSETDRAESWRCGEAAVCAALEGRSGEMVAIRRAAGTMYRSEIETVPLEKIAGVQRRFPAEWMAAGLNDVTPAFLEWARPLVGEIPPHLRPWPL